MKLDFAKEFSPYPFGRDEEDGEHNGACFRVLLEKKYRTAMQEEGVLEVILDDVRVMDGAFIDEGFGELAKEFKDNKELRITARNFLVHGDPTNYATTMYIGKIWECINKHYKSDDENYATA